MNMGNNFTKYLAKHEIERTIADLSEKLNQDYDGKDVILICVLKGGFVFLADLVRQLDFDPSVEFVRLSSYGKSRTSTGTITVLKDVSCDIRDKHVLIVEEIIDTGRTLKFFYERLQKSEPTSVEIVTLLDKSEKRVVDVPVKYVGRKVDDHFLIGYGLDLEERCRNLSEIYYLKYPN